MSKDIEKTLCALKEEGFIESQPDVFVKLIQPARFYCKNCGRSAVAGKNLCDSEKL